MLHNFQCEMLHNFRLYPDLRICLLKIFEFAIFGVRRLCLPCKKKTFQSAENGAIIDRSENNVCMKHLCFRLFKMFT